MYKYKELVPTARIYSYRVFGRMVRAKRREKKDEITTVDL